MSESEDKPMIARSGRHNQRYGASGARLIAGVIALSKEKDLVLLVRSHKNRSWVLPKGGWEEDEDTAEEAAKREAWEEGGIICEITSLLCNYEEHKHGDNTAKPKAMYYWFEAVVLSLEDVWPEMHERPRQWMSFQQAAEALGEKPGCLRP